MDGAEVWEAKGDGGSKQMTVKWNRERLLAISQELLIARASAPLHGVCAVLPPPILSPNAPKIQPIDSYSLLPLFHYPNEILDLTILQVSHPVRRLRRPQHYTAWASDNNVTRPFE